MVARIRVSEASLRSGILELFPAPEFEVALVRADLVEVRSHGGDDEVVAMELEFALKAWSLSRPGVTVELVSISGNGE